MVATKEKMGTVYVKVKLTNAIDQGLERRGQLKPEEVRAVEVTAMVDTGAVRSAIPAKLVERLGIFVRGEETVLYADGREEALGLTEPITFEIDGRETPEEAFVLGEDVLIGQTVLEKMSLLVDCTNQQLVPAPINRSANKIRYYKMLGKTPNNQ